MYFMTNKSKCFDISDNQIDIEIEDIYIYSSSIFFVRTSVSVTTFMITILKPSTEIDKLPKLDLL